MKNEVTRKWTNDVAVIYQVGSTLEFIGKIKDPKYRYGTLVDAKQDFANGIAYKLVPITSLSFDVPEDMNEIEMF